jgi:amino acid transporter/mannitol/fructose-specific phosphotransferase system IIA component (Ntr-type)
MSLYFKIRERGEASRVVKNKKLKKNLSLINVYAISTGTTLSAGFFLLPGLAAAEAGPAVILSYLLVAIPLTPAMLCMLELSTAMPRAGGAYFFVDRSLGPMVGVVAGMGTWLSLILKTAFALIGMGAYIALFFKELPIIPVAMGLAIVFAMINLRGAKDSAGIQVLFVIGLLAVLIWFMLHGLGHIEASHFDGFFSKGTEAIVSTAGFVYISYVGVTNVASVSEEIENPERNLPLGMFLGFATALAVYALGTYVMVGVIPPETFYAGASPDLTPVATAAEIIAGRPGMIIVSLAALLAFFSVGNAGILSSSRYPLAMSRDHLIPSIFQKVSSRGVPAFGVLLTLGLVLLFILTLDVVKIAKLASAFQLFMFALICLSVIIMRESRINSYDPGYRVPLYPWLPLLGFFSPMWIIYKMGWAPITFSVCLALFSILWYFKYARNRVSRRGALLHVFNRMGQGKDTGLDPELREILKEKGLRENDPFEVLVSKAAFLDLTGNETFEEVTRLSADLLTHRLPVSSEELEAGFIEGSKIGATPVSHGAALPHLRLNDIDESVMLIVRSRHGVSLQMEDSLHHEAKHGLVYAMFFLVSPESDPSKHLRILAQIAGRVDDKHFMQEWNAAKNEQQVKEVLIRDERFLILRLEEGTEAGDLIGKEIRQLTLPAECLIAMIRRKDEIIYPGGKTVFQEGDRLTVIGKPLGIISLSKKYNII